MSTKTVPEWQVRIGAVTHVFLSDESLRAFLDSWRVPFPSYPDVYGGTITVHVVKVIREVHDASPVTPKDIKKRGAT